MEQLPGRAGEEGEPDPQYDALDAFMAAMKVGRLAWHCSPQCLSLNPKPQYASASVAAWAHSLASGLARVPS